MVAIKPTRDFTSLNRVSYAVKNSAKLKQGKAINVYREEIDQGVLLTRVGEPSTSSVWRPWRTRYLEPVTVPAPPRKVMETLMVAW